MLTKVCGSTDGLISTHFEQPKQTLRTKSIHPPYNSPKVPQDLLIQVHDLSSYNGAAKMP